MGSRITSVRCLESQPDFLRRNTENQRENKMQKRASLVVRCAFCKLMRTKRRIFAVFALEKCSLLRQKIYRGKGKTDMFVSNRHITLLALHFISSMLCCYGKNIQIKRKAESPKCAIWTKIHIFETFLH